MAKVTVTENTLVVEIEGLDRVWSLKSRLDIPLAEVRGATVDPGAAREPKGIRTAGTHFPGVITAGAFRSRGERVFWHVKNPAKVIVVELTGDPWDRLVIEVDDPRATVALIERALPTR
ncbi:hypothetical protein ACN20G_29715 (plasmid) [Streptomyces sp. BI20]|uniref:hypothetical protein n=1 Tax=Streptomyces sp. BI20 TaxID=3403460 RepID=UPI003C7632B2